MTQPDYSTVDKAIFAAWFDCNWDYLDSLLDARQSGDPKRLASLLDARQRALQSRASGAVGKCVPEQAAAAHGLNNPQPKPRRQRKPSLARLVAKAKQLGVDVTVEPNGTVTFRTGSSVTAEPMINEWDGVLPHHGKH